MKNVFLSKKVSARLVLSALLFHGVLAYGQQLTAEQNTTIWHAKQGGVVKLEKFLTQKIPFIDYQKVVLPGPQFIISDDPEYVRIPDAIASKERVQPGTVRLYVYNVNGVVEPFKMDRKITAILKNTGKSPMHMRMLKYSSQVPGNNYFKIGKQGLADYFASKDENVVRVIMPGAAISIDEKLETYIAKYDELVHGIYEFVIDQPGEVSVVQADPKLKGAAVLNKIKNVIPRSHQNAGRGLFGVSNYQITTDGVYNTDSGPVQIMLADGVKDKWVAGYEGVSGDPVQLAGNYGVMYNIEVKWKSTNGKGLALIIWNSSSGNSQWCSGMGTSMVVSNGKYKEGIIQLPVDSLITTAAPEAIVVQVFTPSTNGEEQTIHITYSPPGASCLPVPLVLVPVDIK
ncbi:copper amine oxidase [Mucilaginibacter rigui]|uniref:Copper amine oxidase n=1 Tax=Mucilaginibacter rigui TaxID=534635 RepID=A0ABR7X7M5_9SPHI|nr:copper amine oxidase [Mucilaginibacter rigui]MBD1386575.1 copper amine oxidase [Mucilaginibacter rigui]